MYLYFEDSNGKQRFVNECTKENVGKTITKYVHSLNPNYKIYYTRCWNNKNGDIVYDVGSHVEFFVLKAERNQEQ